ncbi:MAG: CcmD family protein [Acidobacteriota bacterium]
MKRRVMTIVGVMLMTAGSLVGVAQQPPAGQAPGDFLPVSSLPAVEQLPAAPLMIGAYAVVWVVLLVYVWSIWRRMKKVEGELADLRSRLQSR